MRFLRAVLGVALLLAGQLQAQTTNTLSVVQFVDANTVVASGAAGTFLRSDDAGVTWTTHSTGVSDYLVGISFSSSSIGNIVGGNPLIGTQTAIRTVDGGSSWSSQSTGNTRVLKGVSFVDANTGWAVGNSGTILKTVNGGSSWEGQSSGITENLQEVQFLDANTGVAVGDWGRILRTTNGGATWVIQPSGSNIFFYGVSFINASIGTVAGNAGTVLRTTNGGASWTTQSSGTPANLYSAWFVDANNGWATGTSGTIRRTTNGGSTWTGQTSGTTADLGGVAFKDINTGIAVGLNGTILRTVNGGATWGPPSGGGGGNPPATPALASPANGATNQATTVLLSWNPATDASSYRLQVSTSSGFPSTVYDNGSLTSTTQSVGPLASGTTYYWRVSASNSFGTSAYSTIWNFSTMTSTSVPLFSVSPTSIDFGTVPTGGAGKKDSVTVTNAGSVQLNITSVTSSNGKFSVSPTSGTVTAGSSKQFYITFKPTNKSSQTAQISFAHTAAGSPGIVTVTGKGGAKATARNTFSTDENVVELAQNYPNPFNPSTSIEYYLPEASTVTLTVFNILGQQIVTLVNGSESEGYQRVTWNAQASDGSTLPSGIYIYRLQTKLLSTGEITSRFGRMQLVK